MDGIAFNVSQRVVHPSHVPLEIKSESAAPYVPGHCWPSGRLLCDRHGARAAADQRIEILQQTDELDIFPAAEVIGDPFSGGATVITIEHRRYRIDAEPIYMKCIDPPERRRNQETANLSATGVVDKGVPVAVETLARIL